MVRIPKILALAALLCPPAGGAAAQSPQRPPTVADWRHDLREIVDDIRLLHPDPFTVTGRVTFLREAEALEAALPSLTEEQRVVRAMRLVASLGDGHTMLEPDNAAFARWYPLRLYEFTDGIFVVSAHRSVAELAGAQLLEVAGRPAGDAVAAARTLLPADNESTARERLWAVHNAGLMTGLGYASPNGELRVRLRLRGGRVVTRTLTPRRSAGTRSKADDATFQWSLRPEMYGPPVAPDDEWVSAFRGLPATAFETPDSARPPHLVDRRALGALALPAHDAYYVRTNLVAGDEFVAFFQQVMRDVDRLRPRRLILDWRYNFGGDGSRTALMIQEFVRRANDRPWRELYVLTGRKTFSAAIIALDAFLDNVPLTVVGEPSGAGLNHYGDATRRPRPRTGLLLHVSTLRHQLGSSDDLSRFVAVDVPAVFSFADYAGGRDPAVDRILRGEEMRSLPVIARLDGGAAARAAYLDRRARFAGYDWWAPPREIELRHACDALLAQKRTAEALETCRLNAEIHPTVWNVWFNLAAAQRAAGLERERLASFRCVVAVAPDNWNVPRIRTLLAQPGNGGDELPQGCPAGG